MSFDGGVTSEIIRALYTLLLGGGLWLLLTYGPQRRRINAGASSDEASAATQLSGAAVTMVTEARDEAATARREAAEVRGVLNAEREERYKKEQILARENAQLREQVHNLDRHVDRLVRLISAAGLDIPPSLDPRRGGRLENGGSYVEGDR